MAAGTLSALWPKKLNPKQTCDGENAGREKACQKPSEVMDLTQGDSTPSCDPLSQSAAAASKVANKEDAPPSEGKKRKRVFSQATKDSLLAPVRSVAGEGVVVLSDDDKPARGRNQVQTDAGGLTGDSQATAKDTPSQARPDGDSQPRSSLTREQREKLRQEKAVAKERQKQEKAAEKERQKLEKEAEKERQKQEKLVAREKQRLEKEAGREAEKERQKQEKERLRQEKEAEKEQQRLEKEAEKAKHKEERELGKRQRKEESQQQRQEKKLKTELAEFGSVKTIEKTRQNFTVTEGIVKLSQCCRAADWQASVAAKVDRELKAGSREAVESYTSQLMQHWKALPRHQHLQGVPPTWARTAELSSKSFEAGSGGLDIKTWRRKFLWFPAELGDDRLAYPQPHWPPFYGSWSKTSATVGPRRPFAKDAALDYEVMEDEEWEPEPEGDSLSNDEAEDDEPLCEDSADDGFLVADGCLSEDEGLSSAQQGIDTLCAGHEDAADDTASCPATVLENEDAAAVAQRRLLEAALRKARPRPLIISGLRSDPACCQSYLTGDSGLLTALSIQVLAPDGNVSVPPPPAKPEEATPKADGRADKSRTAGLERPEELVPELIKFLQSHPEIKALPKAVQAFCDEHPERKLVKKWVTDKIKEVAERTSSGWKIKSQEGSQPSQAAAPAAPEEPPPAAALDAMPSQTAGAMLRFLSVKDDTKGNPEGGLQPGATGPSISPPASAATTGTRDPRWAVLVSSLVQPQALLTTSSLDRSFEVVTKLESPAAIPSFVMTALLKTLGSPHAAALLRDACARNLARLVSFMAEEDSCLSPPSKVWGEARSAPAAASLQDVFGEQNLPAVLAEGMQSSSIDVAKSTAMLMGALCRVGCPRKLELSSITGQRDGSDSFSLSHGARLAASAFRSDIAGDGKWLEVLTSDSAASPTLVSYKLLALCYLLHDDMCIDTVLELPSRGRTLRTLLSATSLPHLGAAKYGFLGLLYVLRWHETGNRPLPPEENQFWVQQTSQALAQKLREKRHALLRPDAPADELALVMLEVAKLVGKLQFRDSLKLDQDAAKTASIMAPRDDLVAVLVALREGQNPAVQAPALLAWEALMQ